MAASKYLKYIPINYSSEDKDTETSLLDHDSEGDGSSPQSKEPTWFSRSMLILPWFLSCIFATSSLILLFIRPTLSGSGQCGYSLANEFINPATIPLEEVRFGGSPEFYTNGTSWQRPVDESVPWPENVRYFGEPSQEIDNNWEELIGRRYFSISEEEAKGVWSEKYHEYVDQLRGGYTAGLDVFHTLHCVNTLRKALRPDYYQTMSDSDLLHTEHCLDILRQYVQCFGSTTLIPTKFRENIKRNYIDSDQIHTCRSFAFLRNWTDSRAVEGDSYVERDMSIVDPRKHSLSLERIAELNAGSGGPSTPS